MPPKMRGIAVAVAALVVALGTTNVAAGNPQSLILLPAYNINTVDGANGSVWTSDLWIRNEGTETVEFRVLCQLLCSHDRISLAPGTAVLNPFVYQTGLAPRPNAMLVATPSAEGLRASLHIRDLSRQALTWGTEIPTVHGEEFLTSRASLFPVPADARFRVMLRLYTRDAGAAANFVVRAYTMKNIYGFEDTPEDLLGEKVVNGSAATEYDPGYAELPALINAFPAAAGLERIRLEIDPIDPTAAWWAFATVTNNATQHVTVVSP